MGAEEQNFLLQYISYPHLARYQEASPPRYNALPNGATDDKSDAISTRRARLEPPKLSTCPVLTKGQGGSSRCHLGVELSTKPSKAQAWPNADQVGTRLTATL